MMLDMHFVLTLDFLICLVFELANVLQHDVKKFNKFTFIYFKIYACLLYILGSFEIFIFVACRTGSIQ